MFISGCGLLLILAGFVARERGLFNLHLLGGLFPIFLLGESRHSSGHGVGSGSYNSGPSYRTYTYTRRRTKLEAAGYLAPRGAGFGLLLGGMFWVLAQGVQYLLPWPGTGVVAGLLGGAVCGALLGLIVGIRAKSPGQSIGPLKAGISLAFACGILGAGIAFLAGALPLEPWLAWPSVGLALGLFLSVLVGFGVGE